MQQRSTRQRELIEGIVRSLDSFQSAQHIHQQLQLAGKRVGLATVYRTLATMAAAEQLDSITIDGELRYRGCSSSHHHHIRCRNCGRTVEISADGIEHWADEVARQHGFTDFGHSIEISGICAECS